MKKIFFTIILFAAVFAFAGIVKIRAAGISGWLWGGSTEDTTGITSGIGWISTNSTDPGAGGGSSYGVVIPPQNCATGTNACLVTGYAWMGNDTGALGWIDFASQQHCIDTGTPNADQYKAASCIDPKGGNGGVYRVYDSLTGSDNLVGWARFVGIAKETANNNAGGEDGWIALGNVDGAMTSNNYLVSIAGNGSISGTAWAGPVIGALSFDSVQGQVAPVVTLSGNPRAYLTSTSGGVGTITTSVSWTINQTVSSCSATCTDANSGAPLSCPAWSGNTTWGATGSVTAAMPAVNTNFNLVCTGQNTLISNTVTHLVTVGCSYRSCGAGTQICSAAPTNFVPLANWDAATCTDLCSSDADCTLRQTGTWREVAP